MRWLQRKRDGNVINEKIRDEKAIHETINFVETVIQIYFNVVCARMKIHIKTHFQQRYTRLHLIIPRNLGFKVYLECKVTNRPLNELASSKNCMVGLEKYLSTEINSFSQLEKID